MTKALVTPEVGQVGTASGLLLSQGLKQSGFFDAVSDCSSKNQVGNPNTDGRHDERDGNRKNSLPNYLGIECLNVHGLVPPAALYQAACTPPAPKPEPVRVPPTDSALVECILSNSIPKSETLWLLLTNGYGYSFVASLANGSRDRTELLARAQRNWDVICAEHRLVSLVVSSGGDFEQ